MGAEPFRVKYCVLGAITTGKHAQNLRELREHLPVTVTITHGLHDRVELK